MIPLGHLGLPKPSTMGLGNIISWSFLMVSFVYPEIMRNESQDYLFLQESPFFSS